MNLSQVIECKALGAALSSELEPLTAVKMAVPQLGLALGGNWFLSFSVAERLGGLGYYWKVRAPGGRSGPHRGGTDSELHHSWLVGDVE